MSQLRVHISEARLAAPAVKQSSRPPRSRMPSKKLAEWNDGYASVVNQEIPKYDITVDKYASNYISCL